MKRHADYIRAIAVFLALDCALQFSAAAEREMTHGGTAACIEPTNAQEPQPVLAGPPDNWRPDGSLFGSAVQFPDAAKHEMTRGGSVAGIEPITPVEPMAVLPAAPKKWHLDGSISASAVYIDNIFISSSRKVDDFVLAILPLLSLTAGSPDSDHTGYFTLKYAPGYTHFTKRSLADSVSHSAQFDAGYQFTRLRLGMRLGYHQWRETNTEAGARVNRRDYLAALMANYELTERSSVDLNVSKSFSDNARFLNVSDMVVQGSYNFRITEATTLGLGVAHGSSEADGRKAQDYEQVTVRAAYKATERINLSANFGGDFRDGGGGNRFTPIFGLWASYKPFDSTDINLSGSRSVAPSTVFVGQDRQSTSFFLSVRQRFLQRYYLTPSIAYDHLEYQGSTEDVTGSRTDDLITIGVSAETNLTERWSVKSFCRRHRNTSTSDRYSFTSQEIGFSSSVSF